MLRFASPRLIDRPIIDSLRCRPLSAYASNISRRLDLLESRFSPNATPLEIHHGDLSQPHELAIIDSRVPHLLELVHQLRNSSNGRSIQVELIDLHSDGISQVASLLNTGRAFEAVHLFSHSDGRGLLLGSTYLDVNAVSEHFQSLSSWSLGLKDGADILIYGCELAGSEDGRELIHRIQSITGADVAASVDVTSGRTNWQLEYQLGEVTATCPLSLAFQKQFNGSLATMLVTSAADAGPGTLRQAIINANSTAGSDTIVFLLAGPGPWTFTPLSALPTITDPVTIDATTFVGYAGVPLIELVGSVAGTGVDGLVISTKATVRGVAINRFDGNGFTITGSGAGSVIQACVIGADSAGTALPNASRGVLVQSSSVTIGGQNAADSNVIAFNGGAGVAVTGLLTTGVSILGNQIHNNGGLGIDLGDNGVSEPIDLLDIDLGPNTLLNPPTITNATEDKGLLTIQGSISTLVLTTLRIEFFASATADPSGFGEGARYLGFANVTTDLTGNATIFAQFAGLLLPGEVVTATATDSLGNTSEFSGLTPADVASIKVTPLGGLITTESGGQATFSVVLTSLPLSNVTIAVTVSNLLEATASTALIVFDSFNWNIPQIVTLTGLDDLVADGDVVYSVVLAPAVSLDPRYLLVDPADVLATNLDDETAGFVVTPTSGLVTTESGGKASFTVALTSQPLFNVSVTVTVSNPLAATSSVLILNFTSTDWNTPQTVTLTGLDDLIASGDIVYTIILAPAVSLDPAYFLLDPPDVSATNLDNDTAGFLITPTSGLITTENGGQASFTVSLTSQPLLPVTIAVTVSNLLEASSSTLLLNFTATDWNIPQTVTLTGVDDLIADGDVVYTVVLAPAVSLDPRYLLLDPPDVSAVNLDNDVAGFLVTPTSGLVTTENGGQASFIVSLTSQPLLPVTIAVTVSNLLEASSSTLLLNFTSADWNIPQTVTLTGVEDLVADGDIAYTVILASAVSLDPRYLLLDPPDVSATNLDNDTAGFIVTPTSGLVTTENGGKAAFTISLASQPLLPVTIAVTVSNLLEASSSTLLLNFTSTDWNIPQTVTLTGVNDLVADGDVAYIVVLAPAVSLDPRYLLLDPPDVSAVNLDNDVAGFIVTPTSGLVTTENGGKASFTVSLASQPLLPVTIAVTVSSVLEASSSTLLLNFTSTDWNFPQTVTLTGVDDLIADGDVVYTVILAPAVSLDPRYLLLDPPDISATNLDNDAAGFIVTPLSGLITTESGGQATVAVTLASQPILPVTIAVSVSNPLEATASVLFLNFTSADWNVPHIITLTGVNDLVADGDVNYSLILAPAGSLDSRYLLLDPPDPTATNVDNDVAGFVVTPTSGLITTENGGQASFTVALKSQPLFPVTVIVAVSNLLEASASSLTFTFNSFDWNTPQTVTLTGLDDSVADGDIEYSIILSPGVSLDPRYLLLDPPDVSAINVDNDIAGIFVMPSSLLQTTEAGGITEVRFVLRSQPIAPVTVQVNSLDSTEVISTVSQLIVDPLNWQSVRSIVLRGVDDVIDDGDISAIVTLQLVSLDVNFNGLSVSVSVINIDNDATNNPGPNPTVGPPAPPAMDPSIPPIINPPLILPPPTVEIDPPTPFPTEPTGPQIGPPLAPRVPPLPNGSGSTESDLPTSGDPQSRPQFPYIISLSELMYQRSTKTKSQTPPPEMAQFLPPLLGASPIRFDGSSTEAVSERAEAIPVNVGMVTVVAAGFVLWSLRSLLWGISTLAAQAPVWSILDPTTLTKVRSHDMENDDRETLESLTKKKWRLNRPVRS